MRLLPLYLTQEEIGKKEYRQELHAEWIKFVTELLEDKNSNHYHLILTNYGTKLYRVIQEAIKELGLSNFHYVPEQQTSNPHIHIIITVPKKDIHLYPIVEIDRKFSELKKRYSSLKLNLDPEPISNLGGLISYLNKEGKYDPDEYKSTIPIPTKQNKKKVNIPPFNEFKKLKDLPIWLPHKNKQKIHPNDGEPFKINKDIHQSALPFFLAKVSFENINKSREGSAKLTGLGIFPKENDGIIVIRIKDYLDENSNVNDEKDKLAREFATYGEIQGKDLLLIGEGRTGGSVKISQNHYPYLKIYTKNAFFPLTGKNYSTSNISDIKSITQKLIEGSFIMGTKKKKPKISTAELFESFIARIPSIPESVNKTTDNIKLLEKEISTKHYHIATIEKRLEFLEKRFNARIGVVEKLKKQENIIPEYYTPFFRAPRVPRSLI